MTHETTPLRSDLNRDSYNAIAASWDEARSAFSGEERAYADALLAGLPPGSRILDLGCGTGRPFAEYALARGHDVTGVDQAQALIDLARNRHPTSTWVLSTIEAYEPAGTFAAIVCWDALFHIERARHAALLARFAAALAPGGRLMLTVGGSDHPAFTDEMFGATFFYDSLPPNQVHGILDRLGFEYVVAQFINPPTAGRDKGRYGIVARRR